ncbi:MAG: HK97 family phage major capsid protein [Alphaproteobacteria bacterium]|jgi:HK97 family phage major capsid protein
MSHHPHNTPYETKSKTTIPTMPTGQDPHIQQILAQFKDDLCQKMQSMNDAMQQKNLETMQKPHLPQQDSHNPELHEYKSAFNHFVRTGNDTVLKQIQHKAISIAGTGSEGGVLVSPHLNEQIIATVKKASPMRQVCKVVSITGGVADFIVDPYASGAGWSLETDATLETTTSDFQKISVPIHEIYALPKASQRILDDSAFNIEAWIAERVAEKFIALENEAFTIGDGVNKPAGILVKSNALAEAWTWNKIGVIKSNSTNGFLAANPADALLDLICALKSGYRHNAVFMMNGKTLNKIRQFKGADGRYLITDGIGERLEPTLFGYRIILNEDMHHVEANKVPVLFGDFAKGYVIVDSYDMRILRDPYSAKPHVYFYVTKRVGGDVLDYDAIKGLKIGT